MMDEASSVDTSDSLTDAQKSDLDKALSFANLAKGLKKKDEDRLNKIGADVVEGYKNDEISCSEWMERNKTYMKLATQVMEKKSFPWDGAANVKYPLLTTAALQFASRAFSSLIPSFDVVKAKVIGHDKDGQMTELANKLSTHMSYTLMYEMDDWEENMDKLCFVLPIIGTMYKKVYYSDTYGKFCSELYTPKDVVVNYYAKKLKTASRITEVQWWTANEIKEKQLMGDWIEWDIPFGPGTGQTESLTDDKLTGAVKPTPDEETPRKFLVQYCRIDLDGDDYKEPYIVTVDEETNKVVRLVANFYIEDIKFSDEGRKKVTCIHPAEWFVKFDFLPNPDGGLLGIGFGILLGGINDMINTISNQLIDSATLSNLQAGFIGRGLRDNKQKKMEFRPGEWKWVNNPGKDLKENIFPLPVREPSMTLFNLLGTLVQSGKEVASVAEIFTGKMPGQNTPASTTMATIEQGLKVFTSIYKRIYRSMGQEFNLLFKLLKKYQSAEVVNIIGEQNGEDKTYDVSRFDYQKGGDLLKILPAADANMVSETQKLLKIQGLYELVQLGTINKQEMTRQALIFQGQENITELMKLPPPAPPVEVQIMQMQLADKDKDRKLEAMKMMSEHQKRQSEIMLNMAKAKQLGDEAGVIQLEMQLEREKAQMDIQMKFMELLFKKEEHQMDMEHAKEEHELDMQTAQSEAKLNLTLAAAMGAQDIEHNKEANEVDIDNKKKQGDIKTEGMKKQTDVKVDGMKKTTDAKVSSMKKTEAAKPKPKKGS
jgi:chaperonin GroES